MFILIESLTAEDSPSSSAAETVNDWLPTVVGVPEITPVALSRVSPAGSSPTDTDHVTAFPAVPGVASSFALYSRPPG